MTAMFTKTREVYAEDVVADEYRRLTWTRRMVLRWVSPDLAAAARHLSQTPRGYTNVPLVSNKPGAITRWADRHVG